MVRIATVLMILLCGACQHAPITVIPEDPMPPYDPCSPPSAIDGPEDAFVRGLAWDRKPTACI